LLDNKKKNNQKTKVIIEKSPQKGIENKKWGPPNSGESEDLFSEMEKLRQLRIESEKQFQDSTTIFQNSQISSNSRLVSELESSKIQTEFKSIQDSRLSIMEKKCHAQEEQIQLLRSQIRDHKLNMSLSQNGQQPQIQQNSQQCDPNTLQSQHKPTNRFNSNFEPGWNPPQSDWMGSPFGHPYQFYGQPNYYPPSYHGVPQIVHPQMSHHGPFSYKHY